MQSGSGASLLNAVWKWSQSSKCSLEVEQVFEMQSGSGASLRNAVWKWSQSSKGSLEVEPVF